jgi:Zn-dependent peptidase ImmA (M78 family)
MPSLFGLRLKAARLMAGLSMDALVARMKHSISKQAISKYENGLMSPDSSVVLAFADALSVKPDFFFSQVDLPLVALNFRKKAALGKKEIESLKAKVKDKLERYFELESFLSGEAPEPPQLPRQKIKNQDDIEDVASQLRELWRIGLEEPISCVVDLLEKHGVKILEIEAPSSFDGLSGRVAGTPFIVLKADAPPDRKRLTALHEFAHLYLSIEPSVADNELEKLCHSFGGAFLLPRDLLIKELGAKRSEISLIELKDLKIQYGISMQAIMYRARQHGIVSDYAYESFSKTISAKGWRKKEPGEYPIKETPQRFRQLLHRAISEELITMSKGAYLANTSIDELRKERLLQDAASHP